MKEINITSSIDELLRSIELFKPEFTLTIGLLLTIFTSLFFDSNKRKISFVSFLITLVISGFFLLQQFDLVNQKGFFGMLTLDHFAVLSKIILLFCFFISGVLMTFYFDKTEDKNSLGDVLSILLSIGLGSFVLVMTTNWLMGFVALEMISIGSYILVGYFSDSKKKSEATLKYILFGSVCSAFMLYGISLLYGFSGNLDFNILSNSQGLMNAPKSLLTIALLFVFVGFGFKLGVAPFHVWIPDVYQGAPTPIVGFLSTAPKVAAVILLSRLYSSWASNAFYFGELTFYLISILAISTMLIGNLAALKQTNAKRLMAYSSIGHSGFLLLAIMAYQNNQFGILLFYVSAYVIMNLCAFGFISWMELKINSSEIKDYAGLGKIYPWLFCSFSIVAISLIGLPPTSGFIGKLTIFVAIFDLFKSSDNVIYLILLIVGTLTSVISLFYYISIPRYAFLKPAVGSFNKNDTIKKSSIIIFIFVMFLSLLTFLLGIYPEFLFQMYNH